MGEVLLDALIDSLKILPVLFVVYILIELLEQYTSRKFENNVFLKNKFSPLIGGGLGLIPQCGFSVVATDLYNKNRISVGTLIAVYIATSDEAIPIMLGDPKSIKMLIPLLLLKFVFAIVLAYLVDLYVLRLRKRPIEDKSKVDSAHVLGYTNIQVKDSKVEEKYLVADIYLEDKHTGCCGHTIEGEKTNGWKKYLLHPLTHSLKIFVFILIVNILMGLIIYFVGRDNIAEFLSAGKWVQPLVAVLVGLIPNCASSVLLTQLYVTSGLEFGALFAGLCVNAGIAYAVLLRNNSRAKALKIISTIFVASLIVGYIILLF